MMEPRILTRLLDHVGAAGPGGSHRRGNRAEGPKAKPTDLGLEMRKWQHH